MADFFSSVIFFLFKKSSFLRSGLLLNLEDKAVCVSDLMFFLFDGFFFKISSTISALDFPDLRSVSNCSKV